MIGSYDLNYQSVANIVYGYIGREIRMTEDSLQLEVGVGQAEHGVNHWWDNFPEYPYGFGEQEFDAWSVGFGSYLHELYGDGVLPLTDGAFSAALDDYISNNPNSPAP